MSQNPITNKLSSFIGIILLSFIFGFTFFIIFFVEKPTEVIEGKMETVKPKFRVLDSTDLANYWELDLHIDSVSKHPPLNTENE